MRLNPTHKLPLAQPNVLDSNEKFNSSRFYYKLLHDFLRVLALCIGCSEFGGIGFSDLNVVRIRSSTLHDCKNLYSEILNVIEKL